MMIQRDADRTPLGGRIIYIGSVVGQQGNVGQSVYAASKAGLHGHKNSTNELKHTEYNWT